MESLQNQIQQLSFFTNLRTGLIYDLKTSLHRSEKMHVECPDRISSILDQFKQLDLLKNCIVTDNAVPASEQQILLTHTQDYLEFIQNLWPEETEKSQIYIKDTYFNKNTFQCAKISVGIILQAVDQIMQNQISNCLALTRPPGHHAGNDKCLGGFCFFNNVAIAAQYLKSKYNLKKILIFDWDIHFGNGTQQIFDEDPAVLYFSIHRYDNGTFYPQTGHVDNVGKGLGKGFTINIPWNTDQEHNLMPGDKEYIYAFERLALPIFQQFQPEFILVSAGFDAAKGDPLGKCEVTQDGYAYLLHRLMQLTNGKILVALEGGYNLESLKWATQTVLRVLKGEQLPIENSICKLTLEQMKQTSIPNEIGLDAVNKCLPIFQQYWSHLNDPELLKYQEQVNSRFLIENNISAGHRDQYYFQNDLFLKKSKESEILFYQQIDNPKNVFYQQNQLMKPFLPKFYGMEQKEGNTYIKLESLLKNREFASIMDIKLGFNTYGPSVNDDKKKRSIQRGSKTTSITLGFRISGLILKDSKGQTSQKWTKNEGYYSIKEEDINQLIRQLLMSNESKELNKQAQIELIQFIEQLIEFIQYKSTRYFISSSILIIIDNINKSWIFKWIDFNYTGELPEGEKFDNNILPGLNNLVTIIKSINQ